MLDISSKGGADFAGLNLARADMQAILACRRIGAWRGLPNCKACDAFGVDSKIQPVVENVMSRRTTNIIACCDSRRRQRIHSDMVHFDGNFFKKKQTPVTSFFLKKMMRSNGAKKLKQLTVFRCGR